ncbi:MAG: hypothetical protein ACI9Y7_000507, partial [Dokdonia sp.]
MAVCALDVINSLASRHLKKGIKIVLKIENCHPQLVERALIKESLKT